MPPTPLRLNNLQSIPEHFSDNAKMSLIIAKSFT